MIFWFTYILAALTVVGVLSLMIHLDLKEGKVVELTLQECLIIGLMILCPGLNCLMAVVAIWFCISEIGSKHSITFGKRKEPK